MRHAAYIPNLFVILAGRAHIYQIFRSAPWPCRIYTKSSGLPTACRRARRPVQPPVGSETRVDVGAAGAGNMILCSPQVQKYLVDAGLPAPPAARSSPPERPENLVDVGAGGVWNMTLCYPEGLKSLVDAGLSAAQICLRPRSGIYNCHLIF